MRFVLFFNVFSIASADPTLFVPFDSESNETDITGHFIAFPQHGKLVSDSTGPFGYLSTSYTVKYEYLSNRGIVTFKNVDMTPSFTHSFFFRTETDPKHPIGRPIYQLGWENSYLFVIFKPPNELEVLFNMPGDEDELVTLASVNEVIVQNSWFFVAITYDQDAEDNKDRLKIYRATQSKLYRDLEEVTNVTSRMSYLDNLISGDNLQLDIGYGTYPTFPLGTTNLEAYSCFMIHDKSMTMAELAELPLACRMRHEGASQNIKIKITGQIQKIQEEETILDIISSTGINCLSVTVASYLNTQKMTTFVAIIKTNVTSWTREDFVLQRFQSILNKSSSGIELITVSQEFAWPRSFALAAFLPITQRDALRDLGAYKFKAEIGTDDGITWDVGPFGKDDTSIVSRLNHVSALRMTKIPPALKYAGFSAVTITFFMKREPFNKNRGIFEIYSNLLTARYVANNRIDLALCHTCTSEYSIPIFPSSRWVFLAFVLDPLKMNGPNWLTVHSRRGPFFVIPEMPAEAERLNYFWANLTTIKLGHVTRWPNMANTNDNADFLSCFSIYSIPLTTLEIRQVQEACRIVHKSKISGEGDPAPFTKVIYDSEHGNGCIGSVLDDSHILTTCACLSKLHENSLRVDGAHIDRVFWQTANSTENSSLAIVRTLEPMNYADSEDFQGINDIQLFYGENDRVIDWNGTITWVGVDPLQPNRTLSIECRLAQTFEYDDETIVFEASFDPYSPCDFESGAILLAQEPADFMRKRDKPRHVQIGYYVKPQNCADKNQKVQVFNVANHTLWLLRTLACSIPGITNEDFGQCPLRKLPDPPKVDTFGLQDYEIVLIALSAFALVAIAFGIYRLFKKNIESSKKVPDIEKIVRRIIMNHKNRKELLPVFENVRIRAEWLRDVECIGGGRFGDVSKASLFIHGTNGPVAFVAMKTVRPGVESDYVDLVKEAAMMKDFDHENVLALLGLCFYDNKPQLVLSYMKNGSLLKYLKDGEKQFELLTLLSFCRQIAAGMAYLSTKGVLHRDLACRNILVSKDCVLKVSDFGLSVAMGCCLDDGDEIYYRSAENSNRAIPVRWHPPESLVHHKFKNRSDVWSYGVVVWEIFSLCQTEPYVGMKAFEVVDFVYKRRQRLPKPDHCPDEV